MIQPSGKRLLKFLKLCLDLVNKQRTKNKEQRTQNIEHRREQRTTRRKKKKEKEEERGRYLCCKETKAKAIRTWERRRSSVCTDPDS
jgi:hypothetical protein